MVHALAASPRFQLDGKRIAATSAVIALHLGVLMMLMMPVQLASTATVEDDHDMIVVPEIKPIPLVPVPPKPKPLPVTHTPVPPTRVEVQVQQEVVESVDQTARAVDPPYVPDDGKANSFSAGQVASVFAQLTADIAPAPPYPRQASLRRITGTVTLRIRVDAGGSPVEVLVENSSGSAILDQAAQKFIKARWHFVPATQDGVAVEAWALLPIAYVLD